MKFLTKILVVILASLCISSGILATASKPSTPEPETYTVADLFDVDDDNF